MVFTTIPAHQMRKKDSCNLVHSFLFLCDAKRLFPRSRSFYATLCEAFMY